MRRSFWLLLLLFCCRAFGQECTAYVVVDPFDHKTTFGIDGLKAEDFQARMHRASLPVISATQNFNNRVLVLLETSGRTEDAGTAQVVKQVAELALHARQGRRIGFGVFGERAVFTKGFFAAQQERTAAIQKVMTQADALGKHPALFDSLHQALAIFGLHQPGDTIILVSDGDDFKSRRNADDIEKEFTSTGTRLLVMMRPRAGFIRVPGRQFDWVADRNMVWRGNSGKVALAGLSSDTGGAFVQGIDAHFFKFAWAGYMLGIKLPARLDKPTRWKLKLRGKADKVHKDALIYYPEELPPCNSQ